MTNKYNNVHIKKYKEQATELVSKMTIEQKIQQMMHNAPAIPELNVPSYNWWNEALHGVARAGVATMFPQAIAMAATFNEELIEQVAEVVSTEGRAKYHEFKRKGDTGIYKGLTYWSPNVNIFRDPRWGRGHETYGEDPYLTSRLGIAYVKGLQGDHPKYLKTAACAKHFAVHSGPEGLRHEFDVDVSKQDLFETYLFAFKEVVQEAGVETIMGAYNRVHGEPSCGSVTLLENILRAEWGFDGHVVSDCGAISDFHNHHKITKNADESAAMAVKNGCDLNCGDTYLHLNKALEKGLLTEQDIDKAVIRLFTTRYKLGMFDNDNEVPYNNIPYELNDCNAHHALAEEVAERSAILLKNMLLLPLNRENLQNIAVIGPNADSRTALVGNYEGMSSEYVTILEGIREAAPKARINYAYGCPLVGDRSQSLAEQDEGFSEALSAAQLSDVIIACLGLDPMLEGEECDASNEFGSGDKVHLELPGRQEALLKMLVETGKPVILILLSGSALAVPYAEENCSSIVQSFYPGATGGRSIAKLLFGDAVFSGRLPVTFYNSTDDLPPFEDYSMDNRTYKYFKGEPLYPFGYGLSYTKFMYEHLTIDKTCIDAGEPVTGTVTVRNIGQYKAAETVQLYIKDLDSDVRVPNFSLVNVANINLAPGKSCQVNFTIKPRQMALINQDGKCVLQPGGFTLFAGGSAPDPRSVALMGCAPLNANFIVTGSEMFIDY